jgi:hypothetical protein
MAQGYQDRVLTGKGVTVPQIHLEEEIFRSKEEKKNQVVFISSPKSKAKISEKVENVVDLMKKLLEW